MSQPLKEKIQDYWNQQPCNIRHSQQPMGSEAYFEEVTARRYRVEPHILDFAQFHRWQGKKVLEIGCGIGTDAEQFVRHGAEYTGIDISDTSLQICRDRFKTLDLHGQFFNVNLLDIDHMDLGKFDLVYSYGVIHHSPNIAQHIQEIHSLVAPGGQCRFIG